MTSVQQRKKVIVRSPIDGEAYRLAPVLLEARRHRTFRHPNAEILVSTVTPHQQLHQVVV